jgi:hypothetical protein
MDGKVIIGVEDAGITNGPSGGGLISGNDALGMMGKGGSSTVSGRAGAVGTDGTG